MALNLKNAETERLARELAARTGESLTVAVTVALQERLARREEAERRSTRMERIEQIIERTAPLLNDGRSTKELFDELYDDETGLPK
jgi:antitoxin VapB